MPNIVDLAYNNMTQAHINGQDVSLPIDWSQVAGIEGVVTKVSELNFIDPSFIPNWVGISARGLARAGYHYFRNGQLFYNSARQATTFVNAIKAQGFKSGDYFVCDNEEKDARGNSVVSMSETLNWFYNVVVGLGLSDYSHFWLYSTADILNNLNLSKLNTGQLAILKSIKIWVAGYINNPPIGDILTALPIAYTPDPNYYGKVIGWQYQESAVIPTIPGGVDLNQIDSDFLLEWKSGVQPIPVISPVVVPPVSNSPFPVRVITTINGDGTFSSVKG